MGKLLSHLIVQFRQFYKNLTPVKRLSMIAATTIAIVGMSVITMMVSGSNMVPLFTNVAPDQLPQVVDQLQKRGIPFRISDNGTTILITKELLHSTQMAIMTEMGGAKVGQIGLELFDKQDFGTTSYAQKINYQRALQGELMRSINTLTAVKQSKVILALPAKKTFLEEGGEPSASVVLEMHPGKTLSPEQVRGITFLVSSAVENLSPEKVTVVDSRGKVMSKTYSSDSAVTGELLDLKQKVESGFEERIEAVLSKVVGAGKVVARVDATLNPRTSVTNEEEVNADGTALKSQQTEEELLDGSRSNPAGIPGSRANLPGAEDPTTTVGFRQNVRKELKTSNFEVPKTVRNTKEAAGAVERLSVAVLVDGVFKQVTDKDGNVKEEYSPRDPAEMKKLEQVIRSAIGFNASRGDTVTIENIPFQKEDFSEAEKILSTLERKKILHALVKWMILGLSIGLVFFVIIRPFMRWITDSFQDTVEDMLPKTIEELEELQSVDNSLPGMSGALPVLEESLDPDKAESELLKERIMNLMELDTEKAAGAFSLWLSRRDT
ncbi:MAG: flagellar M-ring protein FliF [Bdellovibrionales bacterium]|nr:flagellar M-ring protein FliF [Bdellovibrionales bacterium]